jgi:hypothetical protein
MPGSGVFSAFSCGQVTVSSAQNPLVDFNINTLPQTVICFVALYINTHLEQCESRFGARRSLAISKSASEKI